VETAVNEVENAPSQEAAVYDLRVDVGLIGVLRWIRRRLFLILDVQVFGTEEG
jgi:hypothetical protein